MTDAEKVKALQAKYARGWRNGWCTPGWVEFLEELARELPTVRVPVRQLRLDRRAGTSQAWDSDVLERRIEDVRRGRTAQWRPLVVVDFPPPGVTAILVIDGNHRARAAREHGSEDLSLEAVFAQFVDTGREG